MPTRPPWIADLDQPAFPALLAGATTEVAIIGGGITGLTAGLLLQRSGKQVTIIEKDQIALGESGYTTAHLTQILDTHYYKLIEEFGQDKAYMVAASQHAAIGTIEMLIRDYGIDCDFQRLPGYLFSPTGEKADELTKELEALKKIGIPAAEIDSAPLPFATELALRVDNQAQFHPRKYLLSLADQIIRLGGKIYERTQALDVDEGDPCLVKTAQGAVAAQQVIIAAHVPVTNRMLLNTKIAAYRTYALAALLRAPIVLALYWDNEDPYHYIRSYGEPADGRLVIVGGEDHKTGQKAHTEESFHALERYTRQRFDVERVLHRWSGQIINPLDGLPYIGRNSFSKRVYVSTGYSGNGVTSGTLGAIIISDSIRGRHNHWEHLYQATRLHVKSSIGHFVSENKDYPAHLIGERLSRRAAPLLDDIPRGRGEVIRLAGKVVAAYRDEQGSLHLLSAVCPHLGCHVHWNQAESSWDCPCHGSRFDALGHVLNGPALKDLKAVDYPATDAVAVPAVTPRINIAELPPTNEKSMAPQPESNKN